MSLLLLHPVHADWVPDDRRHLTERLSQAGLLDGAACGPEGWCPVGNKFLNLVTFLGCSPDIRLAPDPGAPEREFCRVRVREHRAAPHFRFARHLPTPRCPACRSPVAVDGGGMSVDTQIKCPRCGARAPVPRLDWKRAAGYARLFIEISGVYPGEALPTDGLLALLREVSGCDWRYFYV